MMVRRMKSRAAGSTPPMGSSSRYRSAWRLITRISCTFSLVPLDMVRSRSLGSMFSRESISPALAVSKSL